MDNKTDKIKKALKNILEKVSDVSNKDIIDALLIKLDTLSKIDQLYLERLNELVKEHKLNKELGDYIKSVELTLKLKKD